MSLVFFKITNIEKILLVFKIYFDYLSVDNRLISDFYSCYRLFQLIRFEEHYW